MGHVEGEDKIGKAQVAQLGGGAIFGKIICKEIPAKRTRRGAGRGKLGCAEKVSMDFGVGFSQVDKDPARPPFWPHQHSV